MASWLTPAESKRYINSRTRSTFYEAGEAELVLFTTPPTMADETGSDGDEVAVTRPILAFSEAVDGSAGRSGQGVTNAPVTIASMPVASGDIHGYGFADSVTHEVWFVNDSWTPSESFAVGGNFVVAAGELDFFIVPTS